MSTTLRPHESRGAVAPSGRGQRSAVSSQSDPVGVRWRGVLHSVAPVVLAVIVVGVWQAVCVLRDVPAFLVPAPTDVAVAVVEDWRLLWSAFLVTGTEALIAFAVSTAVGVLGALLLSSHPVVEVSAYPYAVLLQTIPSVATAPLIIIWFGVSQTSVVIIATIMAFVPVLSNTLVGLRSTDLRLAELFWLQNATRWQSLVRLRLPAALPYIVGGLRICSTMSVIGVIVAEYISGIGSGRAGLGFLITKSATRLETPLLFAAGFACAALGIGAHHLVRLLGRLLLGSWHESELDAER